MSVILALVIVGLLVSLILLAGVVIAPPSLSAFERERRKSEGDDAAVKAHLRAQYYPDLLSLQRVALSVLLVALVLAFVAWADWLLGTLLAVLVALAYGSVARLPVLHRFAQQLYERQEPRLIVLIARYPRVVHVVRTLTSTTVEPTVHSRDELLHMVAQAGLVLTDDEKRLLVHGLQFGETQVRTIMTPRSMIDSIEQTEVLGPLALDDLHKTGHSRVPVTHTDIDHVVGILYVRDLLSLARAPKHTKTVEKVMDTHVYYIHEDQLLPTALAAFLRTHHHLFVVVNQYRETVGLLSLEDVMEAMIGRKIIDEFDMHQDLREVAARNIHHNNQSKKGNDV